MANLTSEFWYDKVKNKVVFETMFSDFKYCDKLRKGTVHEDKNCYRFSVEYAFFRRR